MADKRAKTKTKVNRILLAISSVLRASSMPISLHRHRGRVLAARGKLIDLAPWHRWNTAAIAVSSAASSCANCATERLKTLPA
jgi:hypothetical protein